MTMEQWEEASRESVDVDRFFKDLEGQPVHKKDPKVEQETESVGDDVREDPKGKGVHNEELPDAIVIPDTPDQDDPGESCAKPPKKSSKSPISKKPTRRRIRDINVVVEREQQRQLRKPKPKVVGSLPVKVGKHQRTKPKCRIGPLPWSLCDRSIKQSLLYAQRKHVEENCNSAEKQDILASMTIDNLRDPQLSGSDSEDDPNGRPKVELIDEGWGKTVKMVAHNVYSTQPRRVFGSAKQTAKVQKSLDNSSKYQNASVSKKKAMFAAKLSKLLGPTASEDEDEGDTWSGNDGYDPWVVPDDGECDAYNQFTASLEAEKLADKKFYGGPVHPLLGHTHFLKAVELVPEITLPVSELSELSKIRAALVVEYKNRVAERKQKEQAEAAAVAAGSIPQAAAADLEAGSLQDTV